MKKIFLIAACSVSILINTSCKKTPSPAPSPSGTNSTGYYAILNISSIQSLQNGTLFPPTNICSAYFSNSPTPIENTTTYTKVNSVSLNGTVFKFNAYKYSDTTYQINYPIGIWVVNGLGVIPSFTDTVNTVLPTYTGYTSLPDTITRTQALTLAITGAAGYDQIQVTITDGSNATGHIYGEVLAGGASSVTFQQGTLANLNTGIGNATINVHCIKNNPKTISGKAMNFTTDFQFDKIISVK